MNNFSQAAFYDQHPPLSPWPDLVASAGFALAYKPRDLFWKKMLQRVGLKKKSKVLDVGCGQGVMLKRLKNEYSITGVGIDISPKEMAYATKHFASKDISYQVADSTRLPFAKETFDAVVSFDAYEHVVNQKKALSEMLRALKKDGTLVLYTLSRNDSWTLDSLWEKIGIDIYSRAAHDRALFVDVEQLKKDVKKAGCKNVKVILFDAFFTLFVDEAIMVACSLFQKLGWYKYNTIGIILLSLFTGMTWVLYPLLNVLDSLWFWKGHSLSFMLVAQK